MNGNFARSILCSVVTSVDSGWYSSIVGICCFCVDRSCGVITARGQTMSAANMATKMTEKRVMVRREFILPLGFLNVRLIFPQEAGRAPWNPLLISVAMPQPRLFRFLLLAALAVIAGFLALAIAVPIEPQVPAPLIALFSPGLKLAEFVTPETGKSFAWTFGWFLRIAIAANTSFYFALFALIAFVASRRRLK